MKQKFIKTALWAGLVAVVSTPGYAQVLEEIVVTAQRREQNLQETPVAITAFTGNYLEEFGVDDVSEVGERTPGFGFYQITRGQTNLALRGAFNSDSSPGVDQGVAVFIDEVFLGRPGDFQLDLFDLERIEVLRGPQGTLFGRNVTGGAVSVVTETPDENFRAKAQVSYGRFNDINLAAKVSGELAEDIFGSVSLKYQNSDGYADNPVTGGEEGGIDLFSIRSKLRFLPADDLDVVLAVDASRDRSQGTPYSIIAGDPVLLTGIELNPDLDSDLTFQARDGETDRDSYGVSLHVNWYTDWLGGSTLTSISAYRDSSNITLGIDEVPAPTADSFFFFDTAPESQQFSQELRLAGETSNLIWVAGVYYLNLETSTQVTFSGARVPGSFLDVFTPFPDNFRNDSFQTVETESYAVFSQVTYALNNWSNLTFGARWTQDDKKGNARVTGTSGTPFLLPTIAPFAVDLDEDWGEFTPKVVYDMIFDDVAGFDTIFAYISAAKGYKAGGWNIPGDPVNAATPFDPEEVWNYEAGIKTRFWDERAQLNLTYFHTDYEDRQELLIQTFLGVPNQVTQNAGEAEVDGIELEVSALLTGNLFAGLSYSYSDGEFTDFIDVGSQNFTGNRLPQLPEHALNLDLRYTVPVGEGELVLIGNFSYSSDKTFFPNEAAEAPIFDLTDNESVNLTARYKIDGWEFSVWGKNLTDNRPITFALTALGTYMLTPEEFLFAGESVVGAVTGVPRTYGVTVTRSWE